MMKYIFSAFALFVFSCGPLVAKGGKILEGEVESRYLERTKAYSIYLPEGYDESKKYPVLYLLHGASDDHHAWARKGNLKFIADRAIASGRAVPMIIVMPDAAGDGENNMGWNMGYFNRPGWMYHHYFILELRRHIRENYNILETYRFAAIAGLSMGGGGALVYGLEGIEFFGTVCAMSGLMGPTDFLRQSEDDPFYNSLVENDICVKLDNASDESHEFFRRMRWYIDCGDDDFLAEQNINVYMKMKEKNIPVEFRMRDGAHNWPYWQESLDDVLTFVSTGFAQWAIDGVQSK